MFKISIYLVFRNRGVYLAHPKHMKRFPILFTEDLMTWLIKNQGPHGFGTTSSFIRNILIKFKNQETSQKWTDADMKEWGRHINAVLSAPREPHILEDKEVVIRKEFENFKKTRA